MRVRVRVRVSMSLASQLSEKSKRLPPSSTTTLSTLRMLRPLADVGERVAPPTSCHLGALSGLGSGLRLGVGLGLGLGFVGFVCSHHCTILSRRPKRSRLRVTSWMLSPPRTESGVASGLTSAVCDDQSSFQRPLSCPALRRGGALGVKDVIIVSTALRAEDDWRTVSSGARSAVVSADAAPQTLSESSTCREATIGAAQRLDPLARCTRERVGSRRFYANLQVWGAI